MESIEAKIAANIGGYDRCSFIGASEIASLCGCGRHTPRHIYAMKRGLIKPMVATERMKLGNIHEDEILRMFSSKTDCVLSKFQQEYVDKDNPHLKCHIDAFATFPDSSFLEHGVVDAKLKDINIFNYSKKWGTEFTDEVPFDELLQIHCQMNLSGCSVGYLAVFVVDYTKLVDKPLAESGSLHIYKIQADKEIWDVIRSKAHEFWYDFIANKKPPPIVQNGDAIKQMTDIYTTINDGSIIDGNDEIEALHNKIADLNKEIYDKSSVVRALTKERNKHMSHVLEYMKCNEFLQLNNGVYRRRAVSRKPIPASTSIRCVFENKEPEK